MTSRLLCVSALGVALGACAAPGALQSGTAAEAVAEMTRAEVVRALFGDVVDGSGAHRSRGRGPAIAQAWRGRGALHDDTLLRRMLLLEVDAPAGLEAAHVLERSVAAAATPDQDQQVLEMLERASEFGFGSDHTRWTSARIELLRASILPSADEQQALVALRRVGRLDSAGELGEIQRAQASLMQGSIEHRAARYKEAIAAFLKVPQSSGLWREARLGMAWSQLRIAQPERALASLALLPGGLTGDPERALVAAMAAGALGKVDAALAVIQEARERSAAWLSLEVPYASLMESALPLGASVLLREEDEGLVPRLRAHPAIRLYAAERRAARELAVSEPESRAFALYREQLDGYWRETVDRLVERERQRVKWALDALDGLEPQLR